MVSYIVGGSRCDPLLLDVQGHGLQAPWGIHHETAVPARQPVVCRLRYVQRRGHIMVRIATEPHQPNVRCMCISASALSEIADVTSC